MKNNCLKFLFLLLVLFPINIYAYSNRLIIGGETIGIEAYSKGIYIVGFYDVDNKAIAKDAGFKIVTCKPYRPRTKGKVETLAKD